jgi:hypothetical protein
LEPFHQRLVQSREKLQDAVDGWQIRDRICRVDDRFAGQIWRAGEMQRAGSSRPLDRKDDHLGESGCLGKTTGTSRRVFGGPLFQLRPFAGSDHYRMTVLKKTCRQHFGNITRSENSNFHGEHNRRNI